MTFTSRSSGENVAKKHAKVIVDKEHREEHEKIKNGESEKTHCAALARLLVAGRHHTPSKPDHQQSGDDSSDSKPRAGITA